MDTHVIETAWWYRVSKFGMLRWQAIVIVIFIHFSWHEKKVAETKHAGDEEKPEKKDLRQIPQLGIYFVGRKTGRAVGHLIHQASTERVIAIDSIAAGPE